MKIVIDIDEEDYKRIQDTSDVFNSLTSRTYSAIRNGTPLPENHGRLIDAYDMKDIEFINKGNYNSTRTIREWIDSAPTIIEADMGSEG